MRISTGQVFDAGVDTIQRNQFALFRLQNQISTGRRILEPADDPVAAAESLLIAQAKSVNTQFVDNQKTARSQLALLEGQLDGLTDLVQNVRERAIQLGNPALTHVERAFIAEELRGRFAELVGIGNAQNGQGEYLFSGFEGFLKPFTNTSPPGSEPFTANNPYVSYAGDDGERLIQVEASRQMAANAAGSDVFLRVKNGNGTFAVRAASANAGTGVSDQGGVTDLAKWNASLIQPQDFRVVFRVDPAGVLKYNLTNAAGTVSLVTNAAPGATGAEADWRVYQDGQSIDFTGLSAAVAPSGDLGIRLIINGTPATGDSFSVSASQNQSVFDTFQNLVAAAGVANAPGTAADTLRTNRLGESISNLDQALDNVLRVRAGVGARLSELDSLASVGTDRDLRYAERLSELEDLDYASAISDLSRRRMQLEAAQQTFVRVTSLSLFSLL